MWLALQRGMFLFAQVRLKILNVLFERINSKGSDSAGCLRIIVFKLFCNFYAFWMYIHGNAIRFRPLIIGAYVNWLAAIVIFLLKDTAQVMIVSSVAVLIGYLIPGYMLQAEYRKKLKP